MNAAFLNHEVGHAGVKVQRGYCAERSIRVVRLEADIVRLCHRSNLLELGYAAALHDVRLDHLHNLSLQQIGVVPLGIKALAGRKRDVHLLGDALHGIEVLRRHRFFIHERAVRFHRVADADGIRRCEPAMHFDQQLHIVSDRLAHGFKLLDGDALRLDGDEQSAMVEGVALERGESLLCVAQSVLHRILDGEAIPPAVTPELVAHRAAEELIDGNAERLPLDVPERNLDAANSRHLHHTATHMEVMIERLPVLLDAVRVLADEHLAELFDHTGDRERAGCCLAPACDALVGLNLHEHIVARLTARRGGGGDGGYGCDFHV